jgi:hypothetical protein
VQDKTQQKSEFSNRTEKLASHLNLKLSRLPKILGISPAMFFAYRTGKNRVSEKAWKKLEDAEILAGILINKSSESRWGSSSDCVSSPREIAGYLRAQAQQHLEIAKNLISAATLIERGMSE